MPESLEFDTHPHKLKPAEEEKFPEVQKKDGKIPEKSEVEIDTRSLAQKMKGMDRIFFKNRLTDHSQNREEVEKHNEYLKRRENTEGEEGLSLDEVEIGFQECEFDLVKEGVKEIERGR